VYIWIKRDEVWGELGKLYNELCGLYVHHRVIEVWTSLGMQLCRRL